MKQQFTASFYALNSLTGAWNISFKNPNSSSENQELDQLQDNEYIE